MEDLLLNISCRSLLILAVVLSVVPALPAHAQNFSVLYTFTGPDGVNPFQSNLLDANGILFGTTGAGGAYGFGTVFELNSAGKEKVLYSFTGGTDGAQPSSGLVTDGKGNLYGTTFYGGDLTCVFSSSSPGCGVLYKLSSTGNFSVIHTFTNGADGVLPQGLVLDSTGNIYGISFFGGVGGGGVVYKVDTSQNLTSLYSFTFGADGGEPNGFPTIDSGGNVYGVTVLGGNLSDCSGSGCGVVFKVDPSGHETVLYTFTGGADGSGPNAALLRDSNGNLFGTAFTGGDLNCVMKNASNPGCGVVFEVTPTGTEKVLHTFTGPDGAGPIYGLLRDAAGNLFDTTVFGGTANLGTLFELNTKGETVLYSFQGTTDGSLPQSGVIRDGKGNLYSNTVFAGDLSCNSPSGCGTIFKVVSPPTIVTFSPTSGAPGTTVTISGLSLTQATGVAFNGAGATFTVNSDSRLTATVPVGAVSGKIAVTSPGGTATSVKNFTVIK